MTTINEQQLCFVIKKFREAHALEALKTPVRKDGYEYGHLVGFNEGLLQLEEHLKKLLRGDNDDAASKNNRPHPYAT